MNQKPVIGIIGRCFLEKKQSIIELNEDYRLAVVKNGGVPLIIVPLDEETYVQTTSSQVRRLVEEEKNNLYQILSKCDGILMPGGTHWYQFDELICQYAIQQNIPILGICLGMQILGSMDSFDGIHDSDRTVKNETKIDHCQEEVPYVHRCHICPGILYDILKQKEIMVNSRHHYHITEKDYFEIDAYSEDGLIEAIHIPNHRFALGIQWHPESMLSYDKKMNLIFQAFIDAVKKER